MATDDFFYENNINRDLLEDVADYVIGINRDYRIIMANDRFRKEFSTYSGGLCYKVWRNRDEKCKNCLVEKTFQDDKVHWTEKTVVTRNGSSAKLLVKSLPVRNEQGKVVFVLETALNITEKNQVQEELKEIPHRHEAPIAKGLGDLQKIPEKYQTIFELSGEGIILTDPDGVIIEINQTGLRMLGYEDKESIVGKKSAVDFFKDIEELSRFHERISREGLMKEIETRIEGIQGKIFDAQITSTGILDEMRKIIGYVMFIKDVSRRKEYEKSIEVRNVRLATLNAISIALSSTLELNEVLEGTIDQILKIIESDSIRIYLIDEKRENLHLVAHGGLAVKFIEKDHMRYRRMGDGLLGQTALNGETKVVDNLMRSEDPYVDSMINEGLQSTVYIPLISKGETLGVMAVSSHYPYRFSNDYVEFLTAVGNQIGMAVGNANLYHNIRKAYQELNEAQEQVIRAEKLSSLGKLAATIAHEINNPLASVLTYIRLMIKLLRLGRFTPDRLQDIRRYLNTMESETARCGEIVRNLLAFSRKSKVTIDTYHIEEIIEKTLVIISHELKMKGIKVVEDIEPDLPKFQCDFKQIQHALLNLMGNASEAMTNGGTLTLKARRAEKEGFLEVIVSDTGVGIPGEDMKNIFEPFFTTKEEGKGVGLGLSVVYGIITRHNASIEVESELEKGSTFRVFLPIA